MKIRILIAILGLDQHELGAITISKKLRDEGMEVIYAGRFNTPSGIVKMALEEAVDLVGLSCHSWEYMYYLPELFRLLKEEQIATPVIVGGSVITKKDEQALLQQGVAAAFGPYLSASEIIQSIKQICEKE